MNVVIVHEWLDHVAGDLDAAWSCARGPRARFDRAAYLAQQAAEKLVKAALVSQGIDPPYTHDIEALAKSLPPNFPRRGRFQALASLTAYAHGLRYPSGREPPPIPSANQIEDWIGEITALKAELESWLEGVATGKPGRGHRPRQKKPQ